MAAAEKRSARAAREMHAKAETDARRDEMRRRLLAADARRREYLDGRFAFARRGGPRRRGTRTRDGGVGIVHPHRFARAPLVAVARVRGVPRSRERRESTAGFAVEGSRARAAAVADRHRAMRKRAKKLRHLQAARRAERADVARPRRVRVIAGGTDRRRGRRGGRRRVRDPSTLRGVGAAAIGTAAPRAGRGEDTTPAAIKITDQPRPPRYPPRRPRTRTRTRTRARTPTHTATRRRRSRRLARRRRGRAPRRNRIGIPPRGGGGGAPQQSRRDSCVVSRRHSRNRSRRPHTAVGFPRRPRRRRRARRSRRRWTSPPPGRRTLPRRSSEKISSRRSCRTSSRA